MLLLKILLYLLGIVIIICSFFFIEEESYSPTQVKEDIFKATHFTKLTNFIRNIYMVLMIIFIGLAFLLP